MLCSSLRGATTRRILSLLVVLMSPACAAYSLGCERVWAGPSSSNNILKCILTRLNDSDFQVMFGAAVFFLALLLLSVLIYLPFFVIRQCCNGCGGRLMRPTAFCCGGSEWDDKQELAAMQYERSTITCYRIAVAIVFLLTLGTIGMMVYAALTLEKAVQDTTNGILDGIETLVNTTVGELQAAVKVNGSYIVSGISDDSFSAATSLTNQIDSFKSIIATYSSSGLAAARVALSIVSILPTLTAIAAIVLVVCSIRSCLPALCTCWSFLFLVLFSLIAAVLFVASTGAFIIQGEAALALEGKPGLVTWWGVPNCEASSPLPALLKAVNEALLNASVDACVSLLKICDNSSTYNSSSTYVFMCNLTNDTAKEICTSPAAVLDVMTTTVAKGPICDRCTFTECPTLCNDTDISNSSKTAIDAVNDGVTLSGILKRVGNTLSCNSLILALVRLFNIAALSTSTVLVSIGLGWGALMFVLLIILFFKGQKLNLSASNVKGSKISELNIK